MEPKEARLRFALVTAEVDNLHTTYHALPGPKRIGREGKALREQITALSRRLREIEGTITRKHYSQKPR